MTFGLDSPYVSLLLWAVVPKLVTDRLHSWYYSFRYGRGSTRPRRGSAKFTRDSSRIYTLVVLSYLAYSLVDLVRLMPPSHYAVLGVSPAAGALTDRDLRLSFRKLSLQYHPDKTGGDPVAADRFMRIRTAYEILQSPVRRFAYDRFGNDVALCKHCRTKSDFFVLAFESYKWFYAGTLTVLLILNVAGKGQFGKYWRFVATIFLAGSELAMLTRPRNPFPLGSVLLSPYLTTHEQVELLHNVFITFFVALSQVGPVIFPEHEKAEDQPLRQLLERLENVQQAVNAQSLHAFASLLSPFRDDPAMKAVLRREMAKIAVETKFGEDPEFVAAKQRVRKRMLKTK